MTLLKNPEQKRLHKEETTMEKTMRGLVKESPASGALLRTDLPIPKPADNEALVKVRTAAICGTDLECMGTGADPYSHGVWSRIFR